MLARDWLFTVVGYIAVLSGATILLNIALDPLGLYRDPRGRKLPAYGDPRIAKYLLSSRYVPANYNGLLVGASSTAAWQLTGTRELRIYNASVDGANAVEAKAIVERALSRPGIQVALVIQEPFFTSEHDFKTVKLEPSLWWCSLGSEHMLKFYRDLVWQRLGLPLQQPINSDGTVRFTNLSPDLNPALRKIWGSGERFQVDPVAAAAYRDLIAMLRAHHVQTIITIPPMFESILQKNKDSLREYRRLFEDCREPGDPLIDFTSSEFEEFRRCRNNFSDGIHLVPDAAAQIGKLVSQQLHVWLAEGRIRLN